MDWETTEIRPRDIADAEWDSMSPGLQVRFVHRLRFELSMTPHQYEILYRLPYWLCYGPEDGAPIEWFNPRGFLLPKFRPGGKEFQQFRSWRRAFRRQRWFDYRIRERFGALRERFKTFYAVGGLLGLLALYLSSKTIARAWLGPDRDYTVLAVWGIVLVLAVVIGFVSAVVHRVLVRYIVARRWSRYQRRLAARPISSSQGAGWVG